LRRINQLSKSTCCQNQPASRIDLTSGLTFLKDQLSCKIACPARSIAGLPSESRLHNQAGCKIKSTEKQFGNDQPATAESLGDQLLAISVSDASAAR
jgi:hypothetical protein